MGEPWMRRSAVLSLALNLLAKTMVQVARWAALRRRRALFIAGGPQRAFDGPGPFG